MEILPAGTMIEIVVAVEDATIATVVAHHLIAVIETERPLETEA